jgi:hypothetical protein
VLTYATEFEGQELEPDFPDSAELEMFTASKLAFPMN